MHGVQGFMYPNEIELQWSILIVLYPYITGLVAGAFILASLERVFNVQAVRPTYRLALLTALAFLLVAPLPLQLHLGHPERSFEMYLTPHTTSAMAMFGFVYLWYLMVVLVVEIWLDYRKELVLAARASTGVRRLFYRVLTLGSNNSTAKFRELVRTAARTLASPLARGNERLGRARRNPRAPPMAQGALTAARCPRQNAHMGPPVERVGRRAAAFHARPAPPARPPRWRAALRRARAGSVARGEAAR